MKQKGTSCGTCTEKLFLECFYSELKLRSAGRRKEGKARREEAEN